MELNQITCGDCVEVMREWPAESIDCCVTSPPYWGLRDYGCSGQLGLEPTPEEYVANMVKVFAEVKRVLKPEGTLWLNLGDSYNGSGGAGGWSERKDVGKVGQVQNANRNVGSLKPKDLVGIPWMVAFALRQDGWYLRQDIIWHKPNPMPESVKDRCTKAHEYIFLLSKNKKYYYDADAIREPQSEASLARYNYGFNTNDMKPSGERPNTGEEIKPNPAGRNKRSVWTVTTKPYSEAHFATFPPDLITPCILAGCPALVCDKCGKPMVKHYETTSIPDRTPRANTLNVIPGRDKVTRLQSKEMKPVTKMFKGLQPSCDGIGIGCDNMHPVPGIVLDPFMGSGTTAMVAYENNRNYVGCELNPEYIKLNRAEKAKEKYGLFNG